jgi:glucose/arabinose dehydrogenase
MAMNRFYSWGIIGFLCLNHTGHEGLAQSQEIRAELVTQGMSTPVGLLAAPGDDARLFIVNKPGVVRIVKNGNLLEDPFIDLTSNISTLGERGLLCMAFHPNFSVNKFVFVRFNRASGATVIRRYKVSNDPDRVDPTSAHDLLAFSNDNNGHNGGSMAFGPDGLLYIATGDDDVMANSQDISSNLHGKILRIDVDRDDFPTQSSRNYGVPADNPYVNRFGDDEIYALGLRAPYRLDFDQLTGDLWISDVGQASWEEVNRLRPGDAGANFGWPCMEASHCHPGTGCKCASSTLTDPFFEYGHVDGCAIIGGHVYRGCAIPELANTLFAADFCSGKIFTFKPVNGEVTDLQMRQDELTQDGANLTNIISFGEDARGEMYIATLGGSVFRIVPVIPPLDFDGDGIADTCNEFNDVNADRTVNHVDLLLVLQSMGTCEGCPADLNGDGIVNGVDLERVINNWG